MAKFLITGAAGQLGKCLQDISSKYPKHHFLFTDTQELDITDTESVTAFFAKEKPDYCINCAAYTAVDKAEEEEKKAFEINEMGVALLAKACHVHDTLLFHISTDFVFEGTAHQPIPETDVAKPLSTYGKSKLGGELAVHDHCLNHIILRTSWLYSPFGKNFVKTMQALGSERAALRVVADQVGTPTYAGDLAEHVMEISMQLEDGKISIEKARGLYHYSNEGVASWYDLAVAVIELGKLPAKVYPILTKDYPTPARRPHYSLMDKSKFRDTFGLELPHWRESLKVCFSMLNQ